MSSNKETNVFILGAMAFVSVLGLTLLNGKGEKPGLTRQQSLNRKLQEEEEESNSMEDPRPYVSSETLRLTTSILMPLNSDIRGPLERRPDFRTPLPFVFILGNHSSGKSSFINYVLQRKIQEAGVAPTDDGFSIIAPGPDDVEMDGPTLVGQEDFGFGGLRSFGTGLVEHVKMKIRANVALKEVILIDSPGMIDSPADSGNFSLPGQEKKDRGYDFEGVAKWFADRADVILLFFDPDKPGTTGETLSVLTNALAGMDHKLLIVLNKADMFQRSADFARSYGALCWNLAKVIPRKDLPRIFTTYTPMNSGEKRLESATIPKEARDELDTVRTELISEIRLAPFRRMDNMITSLYDQTRLLKMHAEILQDVRKSYRSEKKKGILFGLAGILCGAGIVFNSIKKGIALEFAAAVSIIPASIGIFFGIYRTRRSYNKYSYGDNEGFDELFRKRFKQEVAEKDESVKGVWLRVRNHIKVAIEHFSLENLPKISDQSIKDLDKVLTVEIPSLRRKAANRFVRLSKGALN